MSFRLRITLLAAGAVALAIVGAAGVMYAQLERHLMAQVDETLLVSAAYARAEPGAFRDRFPFRGPRATLLSGRGDVFAQVVSSSGRVVRADGEPVSEIVTSETRAIASGGSAGSFSTMEVEGTTVRVHTVRFGPDLALQLARPLDEVERVLLAARRSLLTFGLAGVLLAAMLGAVVARGALAPVERLTTTVEEVTRTRDLSRRVAIGGADELGRLATSFDAMLRALESSVRAQRQLVADASHELRTPLTSLRTNLELLARGQPADESERREVLRDLVAQMERLTTLVADLIDLARDEETTLPIEAVALDEVVATAVDDVRGRYPGARFTLEARPSVVAGVRPRIARAVVNLLDNAAKWSPPGGAIEVSVADGEVAVRDHGPGVSTDDAPRVFDRFWRAPTAHHLPGSGLGLAIVKDVAEAHGGSIALEHPSDGGARFRLRLGGATAGR
ncbi:MAG: ATP-binding protein [Candidatus Limnocylindria bacterium]